MVSTVVTGHIVRFSNLNKAPRSQLRLTGPLSEHKRSPVGHTRFGPGFGLPPRPRYFNSLNGFY
jgi:hypothetical protein